MTLWIIINIVLNLLTLANCIIAIFVCLFILVLIVVCQRQSRSVPVVLACHTCSALLISAFMLASMSMASVFGYLNIHLEQHGYTLWCRLRGFFIHGLLCALYDSYVLQAIYRLCRVVFYRRKNLRSFLVYSLLVPIDSLFGVVSIFPVFLRGDIIYLSTEYYCQTPFTNFPAIIYIAVRLFLLPILFISLIYVYLLSHVRRTNSSLLRINANQSQQSQRNQRDLIILRRLLLMLSILILLGLPSVIFLIIFIITGHFITMTYRIGWLSVSFSLVFLTFMLIRLTNQLKQTVRRYFQRNLNEEARRKSSLNRPLPS